MTAKTRPTSGQGPALAQPLTFPPLGRAAAHLGLLVLGAVVGVAGGLLQAAWFPGGLLLALLGAAGLFLGGARATSGRAGAVAPAAGWMISVVLLTSTRPEGDFLFGAGAGSYLFLLGGMAVAVMCATLGRGRQPTGSDARLGK
ncbi:MULTISPECIES: DUF6113 family protein [unclassified Streptomyces]|uniref:DUF6113 family protein n=1 Tax=unclassified Streptomyces TaxID=2593676 RepID=UPI002E7A9631|nr:MULTISPECIES: DUF6113 family protein [unclassified Streptomyces]MEE1759497.1 DUF6113 family protein [Streptomyces sp. SP18BB07]MEE1833404.1 DUF6113 family protein [Streptomyces sp. SP17KL33]